MMGDARIKKLDPYQRFRKGDRVWVVQNKYVAYRGEGKPFGKCIKDSYWPDLFVSVELWDKEKGMDYLNGKVRVKCPQRLR